MLIFLNESKIMVVIRRRDMMVLQPFFSIIYRRMSEDKGVETQVY